MNTTTTEPSTFTIVSREGLYEAFSNSLKPKTINHIVKNRHDNGLEEFGAVLRPGNAFVFNLEAFTAYVLSRKA